MAAITIKQAQAVIDDIYAGTGLKQALSNQGVVNSTFYQFIATVPALANDYTRAQQARAEMLVDEIVHISDTEPDVNRARLMSDNRKWYASKMQPLKYGERMELNVNQTIDIAGALSIARQRALPVRDQVLTVESHVVDIKQIDCKESTDTQSVNSPTEQVITAADLHKAMAEFD